MPPEKKNRWDSFESPHSTVILDNCKRLARYHRRSTYIHYAILFILIQILSSPANCLLHNEHFRRQRTTQLEAMDSTPASLPLRKFCLGTENGRNTISVEGNMNHYQRLKKSYIRCKRIIGNLEITHIDQDDIQKDYEQKVREERLRTNGSAIAADIPRDQDFHFLKDLEEVTGYVLIFNVRVQSISFPSLKIIWGEKNHEGNALQVDSNSGLRYLNMPSLRSIEEGNVTIKRTPDLCYMDPSRDFVDYSELLGQNPHRRIKISGQFSAECKLSRSCSSNCDNSCFGPFRDQCQTVYRRICLSCESKACYLDSQNTTRCCDDACAGGCYGDGKEKCVACKKFEQDGKCVNSCTGTHFYNPTSYVKEEYPDQEKRYAYGRHCVNKCPSGTLIEERYCVARCSPGNYRDAQRDDRTCVPCNGPCPKVCQMTDRINSLNIRNFINCSEIEGNIEVLNHVFQEHYPDGPPGIRMDRMKTIPPLMAADLDVLRSVKIVTGHVVIDGGRQNNPNKPTSLAFLENLEMIEGRQLYYEKYSLYVIGNNDLKWLGLKSLRKIKNGLVSVSQNRNLCYSYSIPFNGFLGVKDSVWKANMNTTECENLGRKCHPTCDSTLGCWGPGPKMCVRCRQYTRDGQCSDSCPAEGYFLLDDGRTCERCHEQCLTCYGTEATQCHKCRNFERWTPVADQSIRADDNKVKTCIAKCPNETYAVGSRCEPCHEACYEYGCTGPKAHYGNEGCNRCRYTMFDDEYNKLKCFTAESEQTACTPLNNMPSNYFIGIDTQNISKYICQECKSECLSCKREGISPSADGCVCANYLIHDEQSESNAVCANECGKGSFLVLNKTDESIGECVKCHHLCDSRYSCSGPLPTQCDRCAVAGFLFNDTIFECLSECPDSAPYAYEGVFSILYTAA
ncbi:receptor L domain-containing protein [Ditylenchus destructor]|nr:receptor L domain-containing protein [Ditylenchus destructor]